MDNCGVEIGKKLGVGGFGAVYVSKRKNTGDLIAVKMFEFENFENYPIGEISTVNRYICPYLLSGKRIYDNIECEIFQTKYNANIGLELELGVTSLHKRMKLQLCPNTVIQFVYEMALGLWCLHSQNDAHLDIKSENMIITLGDHLKIGDFGSLKNLEFPEQTFSQTTYYYAPPESFFNHSFISTKTDIWSFGVILFELTTQKNFARHIVEEHDKKEIKDLYYRFQKSVERLGKDNYITQWLKRHQNMSERKMYFESMISVFPDSIDKGYMADLLNMIFVLDVDRRPTMDDIFRSDFFLRNNLYLYDERLHSDKKCEVFINPLNTLEGKIKIDESSNNIEILKPFFFQFIRFIANKNEYKLKTVTFFRMTELAIRSITIDPSLINMSPRIFMTTMFLIVELCLAYDDETLTETVNQILNGPWIDEHPWNVTFGTITPDDILISSMTRVMKTIYNIAYRRHFFEEAKSINDLIYIFPFLMHPKSQIIDIPNLLGPMKIPIDQIKYSIFFIDFFKIYSEKEKEIFERYASVYSFDVGQWAIVKGCLLI